MQTFKDITRHFYRRLRQTPLLLGWLAVGPLVALALDGWIGLAFGLINLALLGAYAVLIRWLTPAPPPPAPVRRPAAELAVALALFAGVLLIQLIDFDVLVAPAFQHGLRAFLSGVFQAMASLVPPPDWAVNDAYQAVSSTFKQLIPALLVLALFGYGPKAMGLTRPHWKLTGILVGLTALFGLVMGMWPREPAGQFFTLLLIGVFINALPEELLFRGLLLPRLEKSLGDPLNALVIASLLFNLLHVPVQVYNGAPLPLALLRVVAIGYPSGLIWGYLYLRTRSILPGVFWHAANAHLGFIMMSL